MHNNPKFADNACRTEGFRSPMNRRSWLSNSGIGISGIALAAMLADESRAQRAEHPARVFEPKIKRVIQLFMAGAASHIDLFDFKPALVKHHGENSDFGEPVEAFQNGLGPWLKPICP